MMCISKCSPRLQADSGGDVGGRSVWVGREGRGKGNQREEWSTNCRGEDAQRFVSFKHVVRKTCLYLV